MKNFTVRLAEPQDAAQLTEWLNNTPNNLFDPDIFDYPNTRTLVVEADGKPILYSPFHVVFQQEALAVNPDARKIDIAYALKKIEEALLALARQYGVKELYAQVEEESFKRFAKGRGWAPMKHEYLRRKV